jgi:hypothetical protein
MFLLIYKFGILVFYINGYKRGPGIQYSAFCLSTARACLRYLGYLQTNNYHWLPG